MPRRRNLFIPSSSTPYRVSRSGIDLFLNCPRCFYLDKRLGIKRPSGPPFTLNSLVDALLKKEFDVHRATATAHPLMKTYGIDAVPYQDERMDEWRDSLRRGITYVHPATNLKITGGVDDVWVTPAGELIVVDYKATSKATEVNIDAPWQIAYKRQMEVYQWLLRRNGFEVSNTGYFVYCNGDQDREAFDGRLEFTIKVIPYTGNDAWIEPTINELHACLCAEVVPSPPATCEYCRYVAAVQAVTV